MFYFFGIPINEDGARNGVSLPKEEDMMTEEDWQRGDELDSEGVVASPALNERVIKPGLLGRIGMDRCCLWHKWGIWKQYTWTGTVTYTGRLWPKEMRGIPQQIEEERQIRTCKRCGLTQDEEIKR